MLIVVVIDYENNVLRKCVEMSRNAHSHPRGLIRRRIERPNAPSPRRRQAESVASRVWWRSVVWWECCVVHYNRDSRCLLLIEYAINIWNANTLSKILYVWCFYRTNREQSLFCWTKNEARFLLLLKGALSKKIVRNRIFAQFRFSEWVRI